MKKRMAFIGITNYKDWPIGGMLHYELSILKYLVGIYDVDIWGVTVDGRANSPLMINDKEYHIHTFGNAKTGRRIVPNFWRGMNLVKYKNSFPHDYDIVYAHEGSCIIAAQNIVDRKKTKLVFHIHSLSWLVNHTLRNRVCFPGIIAAQKFADLIFVVSDTESVRAYARKRKDKTKAQFVPVKSPLNLNEFDEEFVKRKIQNRRDSRQTHFIYTGRLDAHKDVRTLILAMKQYVAEVNDQAILRIVGSGSEYENLKQLVTDKNLQNNVKLLGPVPHEQVYKLLQESDIFVIASHGEGVSISVLEAYASGLPVVCFKVTGLESEVIDGVTGVHAKERTVEAFCEAMVHANAHRTQMAYNCLEEAKKYDETQVSHQIAIEINKLFSDQQKSMKNPEV